VYLSSGHDAVRADRGAAHPARGTHAVAALPPTINLDHSSGGSIHNLCVAAFAGMFAVLVFDTGWIGVKDQALLA
jgi:hypothetical protein